MKKEIEINYIEGEGLDRIEFKGKAVLKRLNFSERNALEEESTDIRFTGETQNVRISVSKMKEVSLIKGIMSWDVIKTTYTEDKITKKPIPMNKEYALNVMSIKELPMELGEMLFQEFTELNTLNIKKKVS